ncbi:hypothetical protein [Pseudoxanthomonas jiangsuensis]|uniref:hypothetical protein n=1 Tax=Pseudoxanthomonas jiangsuensis TaxID=619688 RepID=UPI0013914C98|nr:hypothetical protein [Pseudoxanthomonas jiangsuensis]
MAIGCSKSIFLILACIALTSCDGKIRSEMVAGCVNGGGTKKTCTCYYEKMKERYGVDTLEAMRDRGTVPPDIREETIRATAQCSGLDSATLKELGIEDFGSEEKPNGPAVPSDPNPQAEAPTPALAQEPDKVVSASDDAAIESAIAVTASTVMGDEFKDARQVVAGDINGDKVDDSAVLFSIEIPSENTSTQYLAVFLRQPDGSLRFANALPVGGVGSSTSDFVIADETIRLTSLTLGPDDSDCCPTLEQKTKYLLHNGKLKLVN